jgi:hypothetical protein
MTLSIACLFPLRRVRVPFGNEQRKLWPSVLANASLGLPGWLVGDAGWEMSAGVDPWNMTLWTTVAMALTCGEDKHFTERTAGLDGILLADDHEDDTTLFTFRVRHVPLSNCEEVIYSLARNQIVWSDIGQLLILWSWMRSFEFEMKSTWTTKRKPVGGAETEIDLAFVV